MNTKDINPKGRCPFFLSEKNFIFVIGFMCSGKTIYSQKVAKDFSLKFIDLDIEIEQYENSSILNIFTNKGESYFRKLEAKVLTHIINNNNKPTIVSTGGGIISSESNIVAMSNSGSIIFLNTPWETIKSRLKIKRNSDQRPLLGILSDKEVLKLYLARLPIYKKLANYIIEDKLIRK